MNDELLPAFGFLFVACILVIGYVVAVPIWRWRLSKNPDSRLLTPTDLWLWVLTSCPCLALPCSFGLLGLSSAGFAVNVNLDFSDYLRAELEEQYLLDAADEASAEQVRKTGDRRRRSQEWRAWTVYDYQQRQRQVLVMQDTGLGRRLQGVQEQTPLAYQIWELDIFYQAVDPSTGIFTEEALKEIKDFEDQLVSFDGYGDFCRRWHDRGSSCDVPYSVKNLFYSVPNASLHNGSTMSLCALCRAGEEETGFLAARLRAYDGSGTLASIVPVSAQRLQEEEPLNLDPSSLAEESVLKELLENEIRWRGPWKGAGAVSAQHFESMRWTDGDFNRNNLKSQFGTKPISPLPARFPTVLTRYSRATLYGAPLPGYLSWDDRRAEQEAKINAWLGRLFEEFLRRADLSGDDALPYKHVKFTWYERRINNYESLVAKSKRGGHVMEFCLILYYLRFDTLFALGTMATVALLVLARIQNLFITFFGAIGVALAFVGTYYFHFVVAGFKALSILDFVSLFVILGIAADDVLLLFNTYSLAAVLLGAEATPQQKMRWAYKEGTAPMLVTTVTTCGSFYANCFSIVTVVQCVLWRSFGFFMATLVAWNFLNVLIIFPAAILVNDLYIIPLLTCCCRKRSPEGRHSDHLSAQGIQSKLRLPVKGVTDVKHQDLGLVERVVAKRFSPCLYHSRCLLILFSIAAAGVFGYLATVAFHVSEGQIKIFEEDLNLGRLEELRKEVFPATSDEDFKEAIRAAPPDRAIDVRSCPGRTVGDGNSSWCSGQGTCDASSSTCSCDDGFVGQACSVTRSSGTLDLVYLSIAQDPDQYLYAHVLSTPELLAAPDDLPAGRGDFFLRNQGDEDVNWQLEAEVPAWFSLDPRNGVLQKRSFSRTDDSFAGRSSFQAAFDLAGKPSGWSEQMELRVLASTSGTSPPPPPRSFRIAAAVASPPALGALRAFAEGEEIALQPAFDVSRGFGAEPFENFVSRNLEIRYQVFSRSDWLRVDLEALGSDSVLVSGRPLRGTSLGISAPGSIEIEVISSFSRQTTTYFLEAFRSCDGPCPTETSTTATTTRITSTLAPGVSSTTTTYTSTQTQDTDHVVGLMTLTALNCPALRSQEGKSRLEFGLAQIAQVEEAAVSVSVWCDGRRLSSSSRQLQVSPVELLYSMVVVGGGIATADVVRRLDLESPETMTQKLQAFLDADGFPVVLEVLSLEAIQVNPDPTTTATSSTWTFTSSTGTATATTSTATTTSVTVSATSSLTVTATSSTSSSITKTQSTATSVTSTSSISSISTTTASSATTVTTTQSTVSTTSVTASTTMTWTATSTRSTATHTTRTLTSSWTATATEPVVSTTATQSVTAVTTTTSSSSATTVSSSSTETVTSATQTASLTSSLSSTISSTTLSSSFTATSTATSSSSSVTETSSTLTSTSKSTSTTLSSSKTASSTTASSTTRTTSLSKTSTTSTTTSTASSTRTSSRTGTATSATVTSTTSSTSKSGTSTRTTSTSSSISRTSSTVSHTSSTYTSVTSTWTRTSTTTETFTTATNTITFADGFGYIFGEAQLAECIAAGSEAREPELLEALAQGIASLAEVEASLVELRLCPDQERDARRLQAASPRLEYGIHIPSERGLELFPRAFAALQAATAASLQAALNAALRDQGFVGSNLTVEDASVFSGAPPTTRTSSTATSTTTTTTILCPGNPVCSGSGSCIQQKTGDWACECRETFSGEDCTVRECPTCANNASCLEGAQDLEAVWECDCIEPYYGPRCEEKRCPGNCTNSGECDTATGLCSCFAGSLGEDCAQREVPLTNAIEIAIVFGLLGYENDNRSAPAYDGSVDLLSPAVQAHMLRTCTDARADALLLVKSELSCWIESFAEFMPLVGGTFPVNDSDMVQEAFQAFMHQNVASLNSYQKDVRTAGEDFAGRVMFSRLRMKVNMAVNAAKEQKDVVRQRWQEYVESLNQRAPPEAGQAMMVSWVWTSMALEESVFSSTILAFSLSLSTSMVAVALFTRDIVLAFYVCLNILLVVSVLSGFLLNILDYDFGVVEAIGATIFVGLSVDYCLHLAHGYHTASGRQAKVRVHHALVMLTPTILGGALTTIAGCAFLLPCRILLFRKLGWTLMLNAIIAITYTFTFLAPLLMIAGPVKRSPGAVRAGYADGNSPTDSFAAVTSRFAVASEVPSPSQINATPGEEGQGQGNLRKSASSSPALPIQPAPKKADGTVGVVFEDPRQGGDRACEAGLVRSCDKIGAQE
ncbi:DISP3 [Symbiodinium sp. CCMP2592]|nr:DISP3 [Symbiodinium sp. CCMP2592]